MPARRLLLDECVDWRIGRALSGHEVRTVQEMGWRGMRNGDLLGTAAEHFDAIITTDRNLSYQQNVGRFDIAVIVLCAATNRRQDLLPLMPRLLEQLDPLLPGKTIEIESEGV